MIGRFIRANAFVNPPGTLRSGTIGAKAYCEIEGCNSRADSIAPGREAGAHVADITTLQPNEWPTKCTRASGRCAVFLVAERSAVSSFATPVDPTVPARSFICHTVNGFS